MHLPQSLPLHRKNGFARFFHRFISVLLLHSGHTFKPQFFHCFSIVLLHFFIIVPRFFHCFSIANGLTSKPQFFPLLFHSFTQHHFPLHSSLPSVFFTIFPPVLLNRAIVYARSLSTYPSISSIFAVFCHGVTWFLHLSVSNAYPQSLPLQGINGFARFFHGFLSSHSLAINLSFHFINFSSVLPWCYSISPSQCV